MVEKRWISQLNSALLKLRSLYQKTERVERQATK